MEKLPIESWVLDRMEKQLKSRFPEVGKAKIGFEMKKNEKKATASLKWTNTIPNKEGYYWWMTVDMEKPEVLRVELCEETVPGYMYASNAEYDFVISKSKGSTEKWCYIPEPL